MRKQEKWKWASASAAAVWAAYEIGRRRNAQATKAEPTHRPKRAKAISRQFDPIFRRYGKGLPVAFLRVLAKRESNMNPEETKGPAWGLLQVIEVVRKDFNERHGTDYRRVDLLDPRINVVVGTDTLRRIVRSYARNHPTVPNMRADWNNRRFVELVVFGWNAGYSEAGGVGRVARYLEGRGEAENVTIDSIHAAAKAAGASRHLSNAKKVRWSKGVVAAYFRERAKDEGVA